MYYVIEIELETTGATMLAVRDEKPTRKNQHIIAVKNSKAAAVKAAIQNCDGNILIGSREYTHREAYNLLSKWEK